MPQCIRQLSPHADSGTVFSIRSVMGGSQVSGMLHEVQKHGIISVSVINIYAACYPFKTCYHHSAGLGAECSRQPRQGAQGGPGERPAGARTAVQRHERLAALLRGAPRVRRTQNGRQRIPAAAAAAALAHKRGRPAPGVRVPAARGAALGPARGAARAARVADGGRRARSMAPAAGFRLQEARAGLLLRVPKA